MAIERHQVTVAWRPYAVAVLGGLLAPGLLTLVFARGYARLLGSILGPSLYPLVIPAALCCVLLLASQWEPFRSVRARFFGAHEVQVGHDGVLLSDLHRRRFVRYVEIARVETGALAVVLHLVSGEDIPLHVWTGKEDDASKRSALAASIMRARAECTIARSDTAKRLARGERSVRDWVAHTRGLGKGAGYRTTELRREDLWSVLEDGTAVDECRVAAALALGASLAPGECARLAAITADSVSPRVRVAVESAAVEDDVVAERLESFSSSETTGARP